MNIPQISRELIDFLDIVYPNQVPTSPDVTLRDIGVIVGKREVVDFLRGHFNIQQEDSPDVLIKAHDTEG
jgi:hypothetical protein